MALRCAASGSRVLWRRLVGLRRWTVNAAHSSSSSLRRRPSTHYRKRNPADLGFRDGLHRPGEALPKVGRQRQEIGKRDGAVTVQITILVCHVPGIAVVLWKHQKVIESNGAISVDVSTPKAPKFRGYGGATRAEFDVTAFSLA